MEDKLVTYEMILGDESDGVFDISLVHSPANESPWVTLNKQGKLIKLAADEEKKIITGVVLHPNQKIYRDSTFYKGECNIVIKADTISKCQQMFDGGVSLHHLLPTDKATLIESRIVEDPINDAVTKLGIQVQKGSWVASHKINDDDLWKSIKEQVFTGYSIGGDFEMVEINMNSDKEDDFCFGLSDEEIEDFLNFIIGIDLIQ